MWLLNTQPAWPDSLQSALKPRLGLRSCQTQVYKCPALALVSVRAGDLLFIVPTRHNKLVKTHSNFSLQIISRTLCSFVNGINEPKNTFQINRFCINQSDKWSGNMKTIGPNSIVVHLIVVLEHLRAVLSFECYVGENSDYQALRCLSCQVDI